MEYQTLLATLYLFLGVMTTLLGLVILREDHLARLNRVTALMLFFAGIGALLGGGSLWASQSGSDSPLLRSSLVANFAYLWECFFPALLLFSAIFPREHPWLRRHSWGDVLIFLPHIFHFFLMFSATVWGPGLGLEAASDLPVIGVFLHLPRVLMRLFLRWHQELFSLVNLTYMGIAIYGIARNARLTKNAGTQTQLRVILAGLIIGGFLYAAGAPLTVLLELEVDPVVSSILLIAALAVCAGTIAYAIVRHRFLDARWIVRRTILYALGSAVIVGIYLQVIRSLGRELSGLLLVPPGVLDWVALVIPLVFFHPVMVRLEGWFEGWMLRGRKELRSVADRLSHQMSSSLEFDGVAAVFAQDLRESLYSEAAAVLVASDSADPPARFQCVASTGFESDELRSIEELATYLPEPTTPGRPHSRRDWIEAAARFDPGRGGAKATLGVRGPELTFEMRHAGERLGLLALGKKISGTRYSGEEVSLLASLSNQASVSLMNSILHKANLQKAVLEEELALARRIQQKFLPSSFHSELPLDVSGVNLPSKQVGGDYFDFFPVRGGGHALAIADVSGKGVPAALLASMLQACLRSLMDESVELSRVVGRINRLLWSATTPEQFVTLFIGRIDPVGLELSYCNAGHNYPILAGPERPETPLENSDLILGVVEDPGFTEHRVPLRAGDRLLLYTDGVTEARDVGGEVFGEERLAAALRRLSQRKSEEVVRAIQDEVLKFTGTGEVQDDMTMLMVRVGQRDTSVRE